MKYVDFDDTLINVDCIVSVAIKDLQDVPVTSFRVVVVDSAGKSHTVDCRTYEEAYELRRDFLKSLEEAK